MNNDVREPMGTPAPEHAGTPAIDWRPYRATAAVLTAALGLNLYTGNGLWAAYTLVGAAVLLIVVGLVRHHNVHAPTGAVWMVGLSASLHYAGGSMAGLHQIGGLNGLYHVFPWWDNTVHALGSAAIAVAAFGLLAARLPDAGAALVGFLAVAVASLAGVMVELYEFSQFVLFGTLDQGFYTNTLLDLYYNLIGGITGTVVYARWVRRIDTRITEPAPGPVAHAD